MQNLENVAKLVEKLHRWSSEFRQSYEDVAAVTFLPSVEQSISSVRQLENGGYLSLIQNHDYSNLQNTLEAKVKEITQTKILLDGLRSSASQYIKSFPEIPDVAVNVPPQADPSKDSERLLTIYEVFMNKSLLESPLLLYETLLNEKIKSKRLSIKTLNCDIDRIRNENKINQLIYFLKNADPYHKASKHRRSKSLTNIDDFKDVKANIEDRSNDLKLLQKRLQRHGRYPEFSVEFLIDYYEYTSCVIQQLKSKKSAMIQRIIDEEYFILKAKRSV
jgi:hypothetical protein